MAALGDLTKTVVKSRKREDFLVTGGIFRFLRHPNYTGEMIAWTSSALAGVVAFGACPGAWKSWRALVQLTATAVGVGGINMVLRLATQGLEKKQKEMYGDTEKYQAWIKSSWPGFEFRPKSEESTNVGSGGARKPPQNGIVLSSDEEQENGSGI